jgi:hypothetical protein
MITFLTILVYLYFIAVLVDESHEQRVSLDHVIDTERDCGQWLNSEISIPMATVKLASKARDGKCKSNEISIISCQTRFMHLLTGQPSAAHFMHPSVCAKTFTL